MLKYGTILFHDNCCNIFGITNVKASAFKFISKGVSTALTLASLLTRVKSPKDEI